MNTNRNFEENLTEMVFENKNKAYGAYAIRKSYHDNVTVSLLVSSAFFGLLALGAVLLTSAKNDPIGVVENGPVLIPYGTEVFIPKVDKPTVPEKPKAPAAPESTNGVLKATDAPQKVDNKITDPTNLGKTTTPFIGDSSAFKGIGPITKDPIVPIEKKKVVNYVDKMPFMKDMAKFISDHLDYPRQAIDNLTEGTVYVTFVVEMDGSITDIKLLKGIGDGCEQEAMRVVGIMPLWEPGTLKEIPQRVQCNLPIRFRVK